MIVLAQSRGRLVHDWRIILMFTQVFVDLFMHLVHLFLMLHFLHVKHFRRLLRLLNLRLAIAD